MSDPIPTDPPKAEKPPKKKWSKKRKFLVWTVGAIAGLIVVAALVPADDSKTDATKVNSDAPPVAVVKVAGTLEDSLLIAGDKDARKALTFAIPQCYWEDGKVKLAINFKSGFGAHVTVDVQPNYTLKNAGGHGDGISSRQSIGLDAGESRDWVGNVGKPEGVAGEPAITKCNPEINGVDLG